MTREELEALEAEARAELEAQRLTVNQAMGWIAMKPARLQSRFCLRLILEAVDRDAYARGHKVGFADGQRDADNAAEEGPQHHEP